MYCQSIVSNVATAGKKIGNTSLFLLVVLTIWNLCPNSDFGYYRKENSSECEEQPDLKGKVLEFCLHGREEQLQTSG